MKMLSASHPKALCNPHHATSIKFMHHRFHNYRINSAIEIQQLPLSWIPKQEPIKPLKSISSSKRNNLSNRTKTIPTSTTTDVLHLMDSLRLPIPPDIYVCLIKECTVKKDSTRALELHAHIKKSNLKPTLLMVNRLLLMLVTCGQLYLARQLFDEIPFKDFNSWAIIIVGYVDIEDYQESITLFAKMMQQQPQLYRKTSHLLLEFPAWIIVCILKACVCTMDLGLGKQVHGLLLKLGSTDNISFTGSLINFYGKFRCLQDANFVFNQLTHHNTVVWTAKIVNNCREGHFHDVFDDFKKMGREGIKMNSFTLSSVLRACARMDGDDDDGNCGRQVHANAIKIGLESNVYVQCGLVDMYGKCGLLREAKRVFEMIGDNRNIACWNAMLVGYVQNGFCIEAVKFLYQMKAAGVEIQESLINDVRIACGGDSNALENRTEQSVMMCR